MNEAHDLAWHSERRLGIGASDAAAIIGLSPWKTPRDVYDYLIGTDNPDEGPTPLRFWLGLRLEPIIAELFEARTGEKLRRPPKRYWHPNGVMHTELDYLVTGKREHVETKVANFGEDWGPDGSTDIPAYYYPQVQAQLSVTGNQVCHVAALWHGQELRTYRIERDEAYIADLEDVLTTWYATHIVGGIEPALTGRDEEVVRRRFPRHGEEEMVATPELAMKVEGLRMARLNLDQAKSAEGDAKVAIMDAMGSAQKLVGDGFSITYRNNKDSVKTIVDWEQIVGTLEAVVRPLARVQAGGGDMTGEQLIEWLRLLYTRTETTEGARVFRPTWSDKQG